MDKEASLAERRVQVDVAVIGGGTAGLAARRAAAGAGARTVLVQDGPWGTTCVRVGCMPSKLLLNAARAAREARCAKTFGVDAGEVRIDGRAVMARVRGERDRFLQSILEGVEDIPAEQKIEGRARFTGPTSLALGDGTEIEAKAVVLATGSHPSVPKPLQAVEDRVLTNETVFDLEDLPRSLAVVGAGALGIELATAFARLGVRTTVFDQGESVGGLKDPEVGRAARKLLQAEFELKLGVEIEAAADPDGVRLRWSGPGTGEAVFERVLAAAGRPPSLDGLELETAGLALDDHGVPRHDRATLRCGESAVFIAGDVSGDLPVLHEASRQGDVAGRNAARLAKVEASPPPAALSIAFTDPDIASVGTPLKALGEDAAVGRCDFDAGRGRVEDRSDGLIRVYARREDGVLAGGEMVGPGVEHLAHLLAFMVQSRMTPGAALELPFYHPTYEENLKDCLRDLVDQLGG